LNDYFPFGSGLGTYATHASAIYYSPIYYEYDMHLNYEIGKGLFITDTFYPSLAQFGYFGIFLFFIFFYNIYKKAKKSYKKNNDKDQYRMCILLIIFFAIESIADSTFTHNRGMAMLMILAMFLVESKKDVSLSKIM